MHILACITQEKEQVNSIIQTKHFERKGLLQQLPLGIQHEVNWLLTSDSGMPNDERVWSHASELMDWEIIFPALSVVMVCIISKT